jgi:4-aminobutyrate aminotransferase
VVELAFKRGCLFLGAGPSAIRICPPLILTREQADIGLDVLEECIATLNREATAQPARGKPHGA